VFKWHFKNKDKIYSIEPLSMDEGWLMELQGYTLKVTNKINIESSVVVNIETGEVL